MTPEEYAQQAKVTDHDKDTYLEIRDAVNESDNLAQQLAGVLNSVEFLGHHLDYLKKVIIYAKDNRTTPLPTPDSGVPGAEIQTAKDMQLLHGLIGVISEAAELAPVARDILLGIKVDEVNVREETGDAQWYIELIHRALGYTYSDETDMNIKKLRSRYPGKFDSDRALNRDLDAERQVLESSAKKED